ncbi:Inositol monophosphatase [Thalictrum thalictroides]|uniref:Inositol monophosphatase n=1 Tax=Thalictrum thalictroides TaxID=46969 RepID=A0A7J6UYG2_THATH|nr:Inositol monophosphatase [Thalictrum thalictroides]
MVASGRASVFIQRSREKTVIKAWDHAVGVICVIEAGGQVTDWKGSQLDLAADIVERRVIFPSGGVLVTNGIIHYPILEMISANSLIA